VLRGIAGTDAHRLEYALGVTLVDSTATEGSIAEAQRDPSAMDPLEPTQGVARDFEPHRLTPNVDRSEHVVCHGAEENSREAIAIDACRARFSNHLR
jgi:hypothetical protein